MPDLSLEDLKLGFGYLCDQSVEAKPLIYMKFLGKPEAYRKGCGKPPND